MLLASNEPGQISQAAYLTVFAVMAETRIRVRSVAAFGFPIDPEVS